MAITATNRCAFRVLSVYGAAGTAPSGFGVLLLGGTTPSTIAVATIRDLNTVTDLLAVTNVQELVATNYARATLASLAASESDASDYGALDAADVVFSSLGGATNDTVKGYAVYEAGASDSARLLVAVVDGLSVPTNGTNVTVSIADIIRTSTV